MAQRKRRPTRRPPRGPTPKPATFEGFLRAKGRRMGVSTFFAFLMVIPFLWPMGLVATLVGLAAFMIGPLIALLYFWWRFNLLIGVVAAGGIIFLSYELLGNFIASAIPTG